MSALKSALLTSAALQKSTPAKRRASLASKSRLNPTPTATTIPTVPAPIIRTSHTSTNKYHMNSDSNYIPTGQFSARRRTHRVIHRNNHSEAIKRKVNCVKQYGYATITTTPTSTTTSSSTSYKRGGGIGSVLGRAVYYPSKDVFSLHPPSFNITPLAATAATTTTNTAYNNSVYNNTNNSSNSNSHMYLTEEQLDDLIPDPRPDPTTTDDGDNEGEGEGVADYTVHNYDRDDDDMTTTGMTTADYMTSYTNTTTTNTNNTTDTISLSHSFAENEILGLKLMFSLFDR